MKLKNRYFGMRHGQSKADVDDIILSNPRHGMSEESTLTSRGEFEVRTSTRMAVTKGLLGGDTIFYSSPFSPARKTAGIASGILTVKNVIHVDNRLSERWFGDFEGAPSRNYEIVWGEDAKDSNHKQFDVESVKEVWLRVINLVADLEKIFSGKKILLVSHGDVLQITETAFVGKPPGQHRQMPHFELAEIRELIPVSRTLIVKGKL